MKACCCINLDHSRTWATEECQHAGTDALTFWLRQLRCWWLEGNRQARIPSGPNCLSRPYCTKVIPAGPRKPPSILQRHCCWSVQLEPLVQWFPNCTPGDVPGGLLSLVLLSWPDQDLVLFLQDLMSVERNLCKRALWKKSAVSTVSLGTAGFDDMFFRIQ